MKEWITFSGEMPKKIIGHFYEFKFVEDDQGEQEWISKIFWDGFNWNLDNPQKIEGSEVLPINFWENKHQISWREFRASNLVD